MKAFTSKKRVQKIIIAIVIVLLCNFIIPNYSRADFGGVLAGPVIDLFAGIGDVVLAALQFFMYDGLISVSSAATATKVLSNPFNSFMLMRQQDNFVDKLKEFDMYVAEGTSINDSEVDITLNSDEFDKGWLGWLPFGIADKDYGIPIVKYTPEAIFGNQVPALDVNFINPREWGTTEQNDRSITQALHSTIANWYVALRNLAIVILLSVLLYVGIRIVISSTASDKAKYKQMLLDWAIAICIVIFLHYIMTFILTITEMITDGLSSGTSIVVKVTDPDGDFAYRTDLTGLCRIQVQYSDLGARMIYLIFYLALVIYTVMFTWTYVKRAIVMAFLTLMAPLVAITYPIDKISDGKAQAFGIWLKEFIFNALLQPFHLIIYTIFLGAASEIAVNNPIYAILFLAFITPAEKLLRKMFGFEKSSTAGAMGAAAGILGGAAVLKTASNLIGKAGSKGKAGGRPGGVRTKGNSPNGPAPSFSDSFAKGAPIGGSKAGGRALGARGGNDGIDYERANMFKDLTASGISQEEALEQVNSALPFDRSNDDAGIDYERANMFKNLTASGMSQEDALARVNGAFPLNSGAVLPQQRQSQQTRARIRTMGENNRRIGAFAYSDNDTRGMGQWLKDGLEQTRFGRPLVNGARSIRQIPNAIGQIPDAIANKTPLKHLPKPVRNTIKGAVGTAGKVALGTAKFAGKAAVGATIGLAAGITGDDLEDVGKYALAGTALGVTGLPAIGRAISGGASDLRDTYEQQAFGVEEAQNRAATRELMHNEEYEEKWTQQLTDELGREPTKRELQSSMRQGAEYYNIGVTDSKSIIKAVGLENELKGQLTQDGLGEEEASERARSQAKTIAKWANDLSKQDLMDDKKVGNLRNSVVNELINKGAMEKADAEAQASHVINLIKKQKGVY